MVPDAHDKNKMHPPMMQTTDLSLRMDPSYGPISKHFFNNPDESSKLKMFINAISYIFALKLFLCNFLKN